MFTKAIPLGLASLMALTLVAPTTWKATLVATGSSRLAGTAIVEPTGTDSTRATVKLAGAQAGSELAWHIHRGACGEMGPIVGPATAYRPIPVGPDGSATGTAVLPSAPPTSGTYAVTVHASTTDMKPVACGNLKADTSPPAPAPADTARMRP
jgi:hypothetical protein